MGHRVPARRQRPGQRARHHPGPRGPRRQWPHRGRPDRGGPAPGRGRPARLAVSPTYDEDRLVFAYVSTAQDNRVVRMTYDGGGSAPPSRCSPASRTGSSTTAAGCCSAADGTSTSPPARPARTSSPRTATRSAARSCGSPPTASPRRATRRGLAGVDDGAPQRPGPRLRRRGPAVGHRVRAEHLGRGSTGSSKGATTAGRSSRGRRPRTRPTATRSCSGAPPRTPPPRAGLRRRRAVDGVAAAAAAVAGAGHATNGTIGQPQGFFVGDYGRLRTVVVAPDGNLWLTTSNRDGRGDPAARTTGSSGCSIAPLTAGRTLVAPTSSGARRGAARTPPWRTGRSITVGGDSSPAPRHPGTIGQLLDDQLAHAAGVGLPAHLLHHRADQRTGRGDLAVADLVRDVGVRLDGAVDRRGQRPSSETTARPRAATTSSGVPSPASTPSKT